MFCEIIAKKKYNLFAIPAFFTGTMKVLLESANKRKKLLIIVTIDYKNMKKSEVENYLNSTVCNPELVDIIKHGYLIIGYNSDAYNGKNYTNVMNIKHPSIVIAFAELGGTINELARFEGAKTTAHQLRAQLIKCIDDSEGISRKLQEEFITQPELYENADKQTVDQIVREQQENEYKEAIKKDKELLLNQQSKMNEEKKLQEAEENELKCRQKIRE